MTKLNLRKINIIVTALFILSLIIINLVFFIYKSNHKSEFLIYINDVDRLPGGVTAIRLGDFHTIMRIAAGQERKNCYSAIVEVNQNGDTIWEYIPEEPQNTHIDHEIKKRVFKGKTGYFFTDCLGDKIKFVDRETKKITWEYWLGDINFEELNPIWDKNHYYNHPEIPDWSHLNDIDFHEYDGWESMLISIRNFNLILEIDLSSAKNKKTADIDDITWWYGGDEILACPHNPEYLPNGNILIVDSDNLRLIEVNKKTKNIVWEWSNNEVMTWPRDCDLMPDGRHYLVTDIDETFILDKNTGEVGIRINFGGYEADYLDSTNTIIIGGDVAGKVVEYNKDTKKIAWEWGNGCIRQVITTNMIIIILFELYWVVMLYIYSSSKKWFRILPLIVLIGIELFVIFGFKIINIFFFIRTIC